MTINITKHTFFAALIVPVVLTAIVQLSHANFLYLGSIITTLTMLLVPGILLCLIFRITQISFWENLIMSVGLSVSVLEFGGLFMNLLLPQVGISEPLSFYPTRITFGIIILVLTIVAWMRTRSMELCVSLHTSWKRLGLFAIPFLFPIIAAFGAISINNNGSNILTLFLLGLIGVFVLILAYGRDKFPRSIFPYSLYMIGLSLLFTTSLRSWLITGHDIMREYYVFLLTKQHYFWDLNTYKDAYNACLSITILPTILSNLLFINDMYIYKVVFQLIFAFCPVLIYIILKRFTTSFFAFLSSFYFMAFPTFYNDMPMLNRQEIGFLFFGLLLLVMFDTKLSETMRKFLFVIFGISIIVSHYSTNYVVLSLLLCVFILSKLLSITSIRHLLSSLTNKFPIKVKNNYTDTISISGILILILSIFTVFWNTQFTKTSNNIAGVLGKTINGIFIKSENEARSIDVTYSLFSTKKVDQKQILNQYIENSIKNAKANTTASFYSPSEYEKYKTHLVNQPVLPPTPFGKILDTIHVPVLGLQSLLRSISAISMQLLVMLGIVCFFFVRNRKPFDTTYILLCMSGIILLFLEVVLPTLSVEYGLLRLFDQMLFLVSLAIVLATDALVSFVKETKRIYFVALFATLFFLTLTGFISHLTGEYYPQMTLDNSGIYYDAYYIRETDMASAAWIKEHKVPHTPVQADLKGGLLLLSYENVFAENQIFPEIIKKDAYVYTVSADKKDNAIVSIDKNILIFSGPGQFLANNKNLIYNNGSTNIYR